VMIAGKAVIANCQNGYNYKGKNLLKFYQIVTLDNCKHHDLYKEVSEYLNSILVLSKLINS